MVHALVGRERQRGVVRLELEGELPSRLRDARGRGNAPLVEQLRKCPSAENLHKPPR